MTVYLTENINIGEIIEGYKKIKLFLVPSYTLLELQQIQIQE